MAACQVIWVGLRPQMKIAKGTSLHIIHIIPGANIVTHEHSTRAKTLRMRSVPGAGSPEHPQVGRQRAKHLSGTAWESRCLALGDCMGTVLVLQYSALHPSLLNLLRDSPNSSVTPHEDSERGARLKHMSRCRTNTKSEHPPCLGGIDGPTKNPSLWGEHRPECKCLWFARLQRNV